MRACVAGVCECLAGSEERLNELDRGSGDGDCGTTLKAGCTGETGDCMHRVCTQCLLCWCYLHVHCSAAIKQKMDVIEWDSPQQALLSLASLVEYHMGGTSGAVSLHIHTCIHMSL